MEEVEGEEEVKVVDQSRTAPHVRSKDFDNLLPDGSGLEAQATQLMKSAQRSPERWRMPEADRKKRKKKRKEKVAKSNVEKAKQMLEQGENGDSETIDDIANMKSHVAETRKRSNELLAAQMQNAVMLRAKFDAERKAAQEKKARLLALQQLKRKEHEDYESWKERQHRKMMNACSRGNISMLNSMWDTIDRNVMIDLISKQIDDETCLLLWSAENGRVGSIEWLLDRGANIYAKDSHGRSALSLACWKGHIGCAKWLCDNFNFRPSREQNFYGDTPLHNAAYAGNMTLFAWLHKVGNCELEARNEMHEVPFHVASASGNLEILEYLLENLCDPGLLGYEKRNAAFYAAAGGHISTLKFLHLHCSNEIDFCAGDVHGIKILEVARTENPDPAQAAKTVRYLKSILPKEEMHEQSRQHILDTKSREHSG